MQVHRESALADSAEWVGCLTYQSRAIARPAPGELEQLVSQARQRNRSLGITGMLLYDNGRFLQTLEGPPTAIAAVWASISRDPRHCEIEVLTEHLVSNRLFAGWDLLLYSREDNKRRTTRDSDLAPHALAHYVPGLTRMALEGDDAWINAQLAAIAEQGWSADDVVAHLIEPVARAMAQGAVAHAHAQVAVAVTGVAGPGGGSPEKPVGTVWLAIADGERLYSQRHQFAGDRAAVRRQTGEAALRGLWRVMGEEKDTAG